MIRSRFFTRISPVLHPSAGQSLVEVAVAALGLMMVLVAVVSGIMLSVRTSSFSNDQALATKYAQEGIEVFRRYYGELGWDSFRNALLADGNPLVYCVPDVMELEELSGFTGLTSGACTSTQTIVGANTPFEREVSVTIDSADSVTFQVTVSWPEGTETASAQIVQVFRRRQ